MKAIIKSILVLSFLIFSTSSFAKDSGEGDGCIYCPSKAFRIENFIIPKDGDSLLDLKKRVLKEHKAKIERVKGNLENLFDKSFELITTEEYCKHVFSDVTFEGNCKLDSDPIYGEEASGECRFRHDFLSEAMSPSPSFEKRGDYYIGTSRFFCKTECVDPYAEK